MNRDDLKTAVTRLTFDFNQHSGKLYMESNCCCDMTGCIELFLRIDPKVDFIETFAGGIEDTKYFLKRDGNWVAQDRRERLSRA
jgi:hypothetical protein